jgi:hypothetical protein
MNPPVLDCFGLVAGVNWPLDLTDVIKLQVRLRNSSLRAAVNRDVLAGRRMSILQPGKCDSLQRQIPLVFNCVNRFERAH